MSIGLPVTLPPEAVGPPTARSPATPAVTVFVPPTWERFSDWLPLKVTVTVPEQLAQLTGWVTAELSTFTAVAFAAVLAKETWSGAAATPKAVPAVSRRLTWRARFWVSRVAAASPEV